MNSANVVRAYIYVFIGKSGCCCWFIIIIIYHHEQLLLLFFESQIVKNGECMRVNNIGKNYKNERKKKGHDSRTNNHALRDPLNGVVNSEHLMYATLVP